MPSVEENIARVVSFYATQAPEYHEVAYGPDSVYVSYDRVKADYRAAFAGLDVLEIAAGTGYWTEVVAQTARSVLATDINPWLVESIKQRLKGVPNVRSKVADVYSLATITETFSAAFGQFWWSHIPKKKIAHFLDTLHSKLEPGGLVIFTDHLASYSGMERRVDEHEDIYEERILQDGTRMETIKNFPTESEMMAALERVADDIKYTVDEPEHLWTVSYRVKRH